MKAKIIMLFLAITMLHASCESGGETGFSIDRCVGDYDCTVDGKTLMVLTEGMMPASDPPVTGYPKGTLIKVAKTGASELTLTLKDMVLVAQVDPQGGLTIPPTAIRLENENFVMPLTATYKGGYITSNILFIRQEAEGIVFYSDKNGKFEFPAINTQFFDGKKKK